MTDALEQLFWNRSVDRAVLLPGAKPTDALPVGKGTVRGDGTLLVDGHPFTGPALIDQYSASVQVRDAKRLGSDPTSVLYRPAGALKLRLVAIGQLDKEWLAERGAFLVWPDAKGGRVAGHIVLRLSLPHGAGTIRMQFRGKGLLRNVAISPGTPRVLSLAVCGKVRPRWPSPPVVRPPRRRAHRLGRLEAAGLHARPARLRGRRQTLRLQSPLPGVCPSGQRERAVNPSAQPTEVRILPPPLFCSPTTASRLAASPLRRSRFSGRGDGAGVIREQASGGKAATRMQTREGLSGPARSRSDCPISTSVLSMVAKARCASSGTPSSDSSGRA